MVWFCALVSAFGLHRVSNKSQDTVLAAYIRFVRTIYLYCMHVSDNTNNILNQNGRCQCIYSGIKGSSSGVASREEKHKQDNETGARRL